MLISKTAFHILKATPDLDRKSLLELTTSLNQGEDEEELREAYRNLTISKNRIIQEVSWTIDAPIDIDTQALLEEALSGNLHLLNTAPKLIEAPLTFCNLIAENLHVNIQNKNINHECLDTLLSVFAEVYEKIKSETILKQINGYREKARLLIVRELNDIIEALQENTRTYIAVFQELHKALPSSQYVRALTQVIERTTAIGTKQNLIFLDELIEVYQLDVAEKLSIKATAIKNTLHELSTILQQEQTENQASEAFDSVISKLKKQLTAWEVLAQPIQVSYKSRGKEHSDSTQLAKEIRGLALSAHNEYGRTDISIKICEILKAVFAEVPTVKEIIDEDNKFLSKHIVTLDKHAEEVINKCLALVDANWDAQRLLLEVGICSVATKMALLKTENAEEFIDMVTGVFLKIAITLSNEQQEYLAAIAILNEALELTQDKKQIERIEQNLDIIQKNLFASLYKHTL
ncbi:MAG: hypothetical protein Q4A24_04655 [Akkermansia sp.]|nr:hypothetical protein [Akkermansia sp.]